MFNIPTIHRNSKKKYWKNEKGSRQRKCNSKYYGYLVDRVNIIIGKEQVYGTQFDYNEFGQAFPKNITDTTGINSRRISLGPNTDD